MIYKQNQNYIIHAYTDRRIACLYTSLVTVTVKNQKIWYEINLHYPVLFAGSFRVPHHQEDDPKETFPEKTEAGMVHKGANDEDLELVIVT